MHQIDFSGKMLAYQILGEGQNVVLLHGFCEDHRIWDSQIPVFLEKGCRLIRIDLPGFGASEVIPGISIAGMAQGVEAVLAELAAEEVVVLGHSMGGYVALSLLEQFPDRVGALGLIHSHPFADTPERRQARLKSVDFIRQHGALPYLKQLFPGLFPPDYAAAHPDIIELLIARAGAFPAEGICAALEAMAGREDLSRVLEQPAIPLLFVLGMQDQLIPPTEEMLRQTALPDLALIHLFEDTGHMSMYEAPGKLQQALGAFIAFVRQQSEPGKRAFRL